MRVLSRLCTRLLNFATMRSGDERLREEIESHIAAQTQENIRAGMNAEEARRQAYLKFGPIETIREEYHGEEGLPFVEGLLLDIRYALRVLRKSPAFTAVALITLALGIGANVVAFGVLNALVLKPLEVSDPSSLYQFRHKPWMYGRLLTTSYPAFENFRERNTTFSGMSAVYGYSHADMNWRNQAINASGDEVSGNYFDLLGVQPELGRLFHAADEHGPDSAPYVVLSHELWRSAFHADRNVVGSTVQFNNRVLTVTGVASASFHGAERFVWPEYWVPIVNERQATAGSDYLHSRTSRITVIGRLKPGVTAQQATENLNVIAAQLAKEYPESDDGQPLRLVHPGLFGDEADVIRGFLWSVTALALLVLLAACANLATLFAARTADRSRELALRVALGSSRRRLVRQLLTEAMIVSVMGGAAALVGAHVLLGMLNRWRPSFGGHVAVSVDAAVYLAGVAFTFGSALLFGMVPARQAWQSSPLQMMKIAPMDTRPLRRFALRDLLLGTQIAICTLLVTASLVAVRGMQRTLHAPLGFQPQGALRVQLDMGPQGDMTLEKEKAMIEAVRNIPGVTAVGTVSRTPMTGGMHGIPIYQPGTTEFTLNNSSLAPYVFPMSPGYLEAAGTRLLDGRDVSWRDGPNTPQVAVVNGIFARKMWGNVRAIGQHFILAGKLTEVVGIAEDGKYHDLQESPQPVVYPPLSQTEDSQGIFVVRSPRALNEIAIAVERILNGLEPNASVMVQTWPDALAGLLFPAQLAAGALGALGLLAAMLAVTGIFGMSAYSVSRRMKELAIRVALGARRAQVVSAAVGRPLVLLGLGSALGLLGGISASRLLGQIVYQANARDPIVVGGAALTMALLGIVASAIPVRRAFAIDPSKLMREE